jgi:hypothetical protein
MMSIDRRKVEDWLARCRWLATTKLDDRTPPDLIASSTPWSKTLKRTNSSGYRNAVLAVRRRVRSTVIEPSAMTGPGAGNTVSQ